jgi:hypothetical protein
MTDELMGITTLPAELDDPEIQATIADALARQPLTPGWYVDHVEAEFICTIRAVECDGGGPEALKVVKMPSVTIVSKAEKPKPCPTDAV